MNSSRCCIQLAFTDLIFSARCVCSNCLLHLHGFGLVPRPRAMRLMFEALAERNILNSVILDSHFFWDCFTSSEAVAFCLNNVEEMKGVNEYVFECVTSCYHVSAAWCAGILWLSSGSCSPIETAVTARNLSFSRLKQRKRQPKASGSVAF